MGGPSVDLSEVAWIATDHRGAGEPDPAHVRQLADRRRAARAVPCSLQRPATKAAEGLARLVSLVGRSAPRVEAPERVRLQSEVRHFAWVSFEELVDPLDPDAPLELSSDGVRLICGPGHRSRRPDRYEAFGRLRIPASRPPLPVALVIEPWWRNRSAVTLRIRPSRRLRYPRRYFDAAHDIVSELTARRA